MKIPCLQIYLCSSHQFRRSISILSTSDPIYDVSDVGFLAGWSLFALFFFSKGIRTAVFQYFGSCPVFLVMLMRFDSTVDHVITPNIDYHRIVSLMILSLTG